MDQNNIRKKSLLEILNIKLHKNSLSTLEYAVWERTEGHSFLTVLILITLLKTENKIVTAISNLLRTLFLEPDTYI